QHALDWDQRHALAVTAHFRLRGGFDVSWHTRAASGLPWTPLYRLPTDSMDWPPAYAEQAYVNSRRLPWSENTNFAVRFTPGLFPRVAVLLSASNLFDNATDRLATISGYPNPRIGTWYDHYGAFRTETGLGGGAYWNDTDADGIREWVRGQPVAQLPPGLAKRGGLPPGLAKQLRKNGTLPPGLEKRITAFPTELSRRLGPLPPGCGCDRVFFDGKALIVARAAGAILDLVELF
ncbi:MAG: hypothetical protein HUU11_15120, partial [Anaerolineales bacterium]|nr:hypothetical protein [Anaerolineales bacterium]